MTRVVLAELYRLVRRRTMVAAAAGSLLFASVATLAVFSSAQATEAHSGGGTTLAALAGPGGGTEAFAVGASFAWAGPFENIVVDSWATGYRVFPGRVLAALIQGGTAQLGMGRAALTAGLYTAAAAGVTLVLVSRRDVTA